MMTLSGPKLVCKLPLNACIVDLTGQEFEGMGEGIKELTWRMQVREHESFAADGGWTSETSRDW